MRKTSRRKWNPLLKVDWCESSSSSVRISWSESVVADNVEESSEHCNKERHKMGLDAISQDWESRARVKEENSLGEPSSLGHVEGGRQKSQRRKAKDALLIRNPSGRELKSVSVEVGDIDDVKYLKNVSTVTLKCPKTVLSVPFEEITERIVRNNSSDSWIACWGSHKNISFSSSSVNRQSTSTPVLYSSSVQWVNRCSMRLRILWWKSNSSSPTILINRTCRCSFSFRDRSSDQVQDEETWLSLHILRPSSSWGTSLPSVVGPCHHPVWGAIIFSWNAFPLFSWDRPMELSFRLLGSTICYSNFNSISDSISLFQLALFEDFTTQLTLRSTNLWEKEPSAEIKMRMRMKT